MTKILITVYLNTVFRILWKEVRKEQERVDSGSAPCPNWVAVAMILRSFLWPIVLTYNLIEIFIKGLPKKTKGA